MESLFFVLLFSVVVIAWMSQGAQPYVPVRQVRHQPMLMIENQGLPRILGHSLRLDYATVRTRRQMAAHVRADRSTDSGRGRPLRDLK